MKPARKRAQAIAQGRGRDARVVIPLAFELAARISARPLEAFRNDPTQLANGLAELRQAIAAEGIVCALAGGMERASAPDGILDVTAIAVHGAVAASLEACRRLRQSQGDDVALLAGLSGPATLAHEFAVDAVTAGSAFAALVKVFCEAGVDVILMIEAQPEPSDEIYSDSLRTATNIARFHQASLLGWSGSLLPAPQRIPFATPSSGGPGIVTTAEYIATEADLGALRAWVTEVSAA